MQIKDKYSEKKNEIINVAESLFLTKGYTKCTVNNIIDDLGIAKGTFYYYFKSKEEVLDSIINRVTETVSKRAETIKNNKNLSPVEKFINIILSMNVRNEVDDKFLEKLHKPENALIHQKSLTLMVKKITPILEKIVNEGIDKGVFKSEYPKQYIQIFLTSSITLLDDGMFEISLQDQQYIIVALLSILDKTLGVEDGTFWKVVEQHYQ